MTSKYAEKTIMLVESVISGSLVDRDELDKEICSIEGGITSLEAGILHAAQHYLTDKDIRDVDQEYHRRQLSELSKKLAILRASQSP